MILTFSSIAKVIKVIEAEPDTQFEKLIPIICEQFGFEGCKLIYKGKILNPDSTVESTGYKPEEKILVTLAGKKVTAPAAPATPSPATPATPAPDATPAATPAAAAPAPTSGAPVIVRSAIRYPRKKLIPSPTISTTLEIKYDSAQEKAPEPNPVDTLSDEEYIKNRIEALPNKDKFDENVAELLNINPDRNLVIRALLATDNNVVYASNMLCFDTDKIPPLRRPAAPPRREQVDMKALIDNQIKNQIITTILPPHLGRECVLDFPTIILDQIDTQIITSTKIKKESFLKRIFTQTGTNLYEYDNVLRRSGIANLNSPSRAMAVLGFVLRGRALLHITQLPYLSSKDMVGANPELDELPPKDRENVQNISRQTGVPIDIALQYYDACDHNVDLAIQQIRFSME